MGRTYSEERFSEQRNYTSLSMKPVLVGAYCVLSALTGYALTGPVTDRQAVDRTLKMCNEKPLECKFKYDIIRYHETGQIPYKQEKPVEKKPK